MPSKNKTEYLGLNQWEGNEYPKRTDFVEDYAKIDRVVKNLAEGTVENEKLKTVDKSYSGAVNEVNEKIMLHTGDDTRHFTKAEKEKLEGIQEGATNYHHPSTHPVSMITGLHSVATSGDYSQLNNKPTSLPANGGNADKLDGYHGSSSTTPNTYALRDGAGDITCRLLRPEYTSLTTTPNYLLAQHQVGLGNDNYARPVSLSQLKSSLGKMPSAENADKVGGYTGAQLLEASSRSVIKSVQRGILYGGDSATIAPIDINKSILITSGDGQHWNSGVSNKGLYLASATKISYVGDAWATRIAWQVIEFN